MKIILTCHTEYDLNSEEGNFTFKHISVLFKFFDIVKVPVTLSLMVGGPVGDKLLKFVENIKFPFGSEKSIHYHGDNTNEKEITDCFNAFEQIIKTEPSSFVFGKWLINNNAFPLLYKLGIRTDGSGTGNFIIKSPFYIKNILEVPVICDGENPANPFSRLSNFFLIRKIIKKYYQENFILHIGFHSYDLFRFNRRPRLRLIKKIIFKNILRLAQRYKVETINLSEVTTTEFQDLKSLKFPFFSKISRIIGH